MGLHLPGVECKIVSGGRFRIDGGAMFGVVPKVLWERKLKPDEQNRISMDTNCLLVRTGGQNVLVDSGYGDKFSQRQREHYALEGSQTLTASLWNIDLRPGDVDGVILTHLHFDHAGGCLVTDESGRLRPAFPRARYFVQKTEWQDAMSGAPELVGAYFKQDFVPLEEAGVIEFLEDDAEPFPGIRCRVTGGHTAGHQILNLGHGERRAVYLADLCPTTAHLQTLWTMAFDTSPLDIRRVKPSVLGEIVDQDGVAIFAHDPHVKAARLARHPKRQFVVSEVLEI